MDVKQILAKCDYTLLKPTATYEDIKVVVDEGIEFGTASICIPPCYVKLASCYAAKRIPICTVIGFPNGYNSTAVKVAEAKEAIVGGADEIDAVINIGQIKAQNYAYVLDEIKALRDVTGDRTLKIIIETCLLTQDEKLKMCELVCLGNADFIKTSTGFSTGGATKEDVKLLKEHVKGHALVKASGGIRTLQEAEEYLLLGADRIGTSSIIKSIKNSI